MKCKNYASEYMDTQRATKGHGFGEPTWLDRSYEERMRYDVGGY